MYVLYIECVYLFLCHLYFLGDQADFWGLHSTRYLYKGFLFLVFPPLFFQSVSVYRIEKLGMANQYCSAGAGAQELHVLAVDDSLVDRKVIERLLKISSCKGLIFFFLNWGSFGSGIWCNSVCLSVEMLFFFLIFAVTAVESGRRALQYLGLDGDKNAVGFDVIIIYLSFLQEKIHVFLLFSVIISMLV